MRKFGILGHPLGHSLSPQIHAALFALDGETVDYQMYDIPPEELNAKFDFLATLDGFNITIPHKVSIIDFCDRLDEGAKRYRSVNCIKVGAEKIGYNTDVIGFTKSIAALGASLDSRVLLIGCGGVGRMMAIETTLQGGDLTIAALKSDAALAEEVVKEIKALKSDAKVQIAWISGAALDKSDLPAGAEYDLLVNACPVGMYPKVDRMPCTPAVLDGVKFVFDAVYNPKVTLLAKTAREKGAKAMTGMAMLVLQAVAAHEIWDGASYKTEDINKIISDMEELI
ncbi:MAG: shikimate dehydrogenase [Oscillospiraceae bacterium]|nr:shikimate dehydrogenase [Oscillospiraceae bacterium]